MKNRSPIESRRLTATVERCFSTQKTNGEPVEAWVTYATIRCSIKPLSGRELETARMSWSTVTHKINCSFIRGVVPKMRIVFGSRIFDIASVLNLEEANEELEIIAVEVSSNERD
jgi:SPP1 family predicted phage head-tail adaptor